MHKAPNVAERPGNRVYMMTLNKHLEAKILRLYPVEQWRVGTIARQLGIHHNSVNRVLCQMGPPKSESALRPPMQYGFSPFVGTSKRVR